MFQYYSPMIFIRRKIAAVIGRRSVPSQISNSIGGHGNDFINLGTIGNGEPGPVGPQGPAGPAGPQGPEGSQGEPGVSVVSAEVDPNPGDLYIHLSDGTEINAGNVIGPQGEPGVSVVSAEVDPNPGDLYIHLSDGTEINAGNVIGPPGPQGPAGPAGSCECRVTYISSNYTATVDDYFIGVISPSEKNIEVKLPSKVGTTPCQILTIKDLRGPGGFKVKISPVNGQLIENKSFLEIQQPYESLTLLGANGNWWVIANVQQS